MCVFFYIGVVIISNNSLVPIVNRYKIVLSFQKIRISKQNAFRMIYQSLDFKMVY